MSAPPTLHDRGASPEAGLEEVQALLGQAQALAAQGAIDAAAAVARQAIALQPDRPESHVALGGMLRTNGRPGEAKAAYLEALRLRPGLPSAIFGLAKTLRNEGQIVEARKLFKQLLALNSSLPIFVQASLNLPVICGSAAEILAERKRYIQVLAEAQRRPGELDPENQLVNSWFHLAYHGLDDRPIMEALDRLLAAKAPMLQATADHLAAWRPPEGRRIKVAFVSALLCHHTVGRLFRGMIAGLDRSRFEVVVAHLPLTPRDAVRAAISAAADIAIDLPVGVRAQHQRLAQERLDVLFFPDVGMSEASYLLARARLAPVQAVAWGHPDTTGLSSLDYFLSSDLIEAEGAERHYTERLVRLSRLPCVYGAPPEVQPLDRAELGLPAAGALYGCPQSLFKLHPDFDAVLARIVDQDPAGSLVFIEGQRAFEREALQARWAKRFPILNTRSHFLPRMSGDRFLGLLARMDVLLDPPHFGSGNTLYEGMSLGVPVVTWPGRFARGRIVAGAYRQMGVEDAPVAARLEDYAGLAVALAADHDRLERLRVQLRERAAAALFGDTDALAEFETFLEAAVAAAGRGEKLPSGWKPAS